MEYTTEELRERKAIQEIIERLQKNANDPNGLSSVALVAELELEYDPALVEQALITTSTSH